MINPGLTMLILGVAVLFGPAAPCRASSPGASAGEQWRLGFIEGSIRSNPHLREFGIAVNILENGRIALDGAVNSTSAKALAEQIAINVSHEEVIENRLQIEEPAASAGSEPD